MRKAISVDFRNEIMFTTFQFLFVCGIFLLGPSISLYGLSSRLENTKIVSLLCKGPTYTLIRSLLMSPILLKEIAPEYRYVTKLHASL